MKKKKMFKEEALKTLEEVASYPVIDYEKCIACKQGF